MESKKSGKEVCFMLYEFGSAVQVGFSDIHTPVNSIDYIIITFLLHIPVLNAYTFSIYNVLQ